MSDEERLLKLQTVASLADLMQRFFTFRMGLGYLMETDGLMQHPVFDAMRKECKQLCKDLYG